MRRWTGDTDASAAMEPAPSRAARRARTTRPAEVIPSPPHEIAIAAAPTAPAGFKGGAWRGFKRRRR